MSNARTEAINAIRTLILTVSGTHADRVLIGPIDPAKVGDKPVVGIVMDSDSGERTDASKTRRKMRLEIGVVCKIDPVKADPDIQLAELYDAIHAKLETGIDGQASKFSQLQEESAGIDFETIIGPTRLRAASAVWTCIYYRTLGAVS